MIQAKCIQKFRNKQNQIVGYRLQDLQGNLKDVTPQQLKQAIQNNQINITNLTLTSDNRLINTTKQPKQTSQNQPKNKTSTPKIQYSLLTREIVEQINKPKALKFQSNQNLEAINSKATLLGYKVTKLSNDFLSIESNTEIILVSNKQIQLGNTHYGNGSPIGLFQDTDFTSIDFHNTDTSNVTNMERMFFRCKAQTIDLSSFDTSNVTNMEHMFWNCRAQAIDLSSFNTKHVKYMSSMFEGCEAQNLDLSSFDTSNVKYMDCMFNDCRAKNLDLSSFDTSRVTAMNYMFGHCKTQTIDLSSFDTSNVTTMECMLADCQAKTIDLSSFNTSNVTNMEYMFWNCKAQIKTTDPKLIEQIQNRYS